MAQQDQHIDVVATALAEVTSQHADKQKYRAFITAVLQQWQPLMDACEQMLLWRAIEYAEGDALFKIAEIVGAPIVYTDQLLYIYIGFDDQQYGLPMFDETNSGIVGGRWRETTEEDFSNPDDVWEAQRVVIKAKILKNQSHGYTPEIQESVSMLFSATMAFVQNNKDMSFDVNVAALLTPVEVRLMRDYDILPRPAGVQIKNFMYWDGTLPVFGFAHQAGTSGFGVGYFALRLAVS